jgi:Na+/proline symporter
LFLIQRGLSTGISIYAPAIILSTILQMDIAITTFIMGVLVIFYTVWGGAKAVSHTQVLQMGVIFGGLMLAGYMVVSLLPSHMHLGDTLRLAGKMGKTQVISWDFNHHDRYNVWSGLLGGFFLQLSYFGTDQSQVGRYLTAKNNTESRLGLLLNGIFKIPMQFGILLLGVLVFVFYQFNQPPLFFNEYELNRVNHSEQAVAFRQVSQAYDQVFEAKKQEAIRVAARPEYPAITLQSLQKQADSLRGEAQNIIKKVNPKADDKDYVFLYFVIKNLPVGLVGLLIAIVFLAAMGSLSSGLASLGATTSIDFYKRFSASPSTDAQYLLTSRWITIVWGAFCIVMAFFAHRFGNLIEAVNILGSWVYGVILGIFLTAFYLKSVRRGSSVFWAAILAEALVLAAYFGDWVAYLWLNVLGAVAVMALAWLFEKYQNLQEVGR